MAIIDVEHLSIAFEQQGNMQSPVLSDLSVRLEAGEILAIVGSSGSGKSLLAHAILGILPQNAKVDGRISYEGESLTENRLARLRGEELVFIPQSVNYLDPLMKVGKQVAYAVKSGNRKAKQRQAFRRYRLKEDVEGNYPFELSGGMARRVLLATAAVTNAKVVIADEPTPGLDPQVLKEALGNFQQFKAEGCAVMMITHDIEAALQIADKIAVFYAGTIVEIASVKDFTGDGENLRHPYTIALWRALPQNGFQPIPGTQPTVDALPPGCSFAPRCPWKTDACDIERPPLRAVRDGEVRCIHAT
ncbi:MAG TPA: ABC transporter ATP-binding protein [Sporosarcina sp.]|nr:ABC transporter ATP-binding protein [Sporosarcina sp.]